MYSSSRVAVDKGLGFDFSEITNLVKTALPAGLQIFGQQMQLEAIKKNPTVAMPIYNALPIVRPITAVSAVPRIVSVPSQGMDATTMLLVGGGLLAGGIVLFKMLK